MNEVVTTQEDSFLAVMEKVALSPDADLKKMQALLDMQERILDKKSKQEFSVALSDMQSSIPVIAEESSAHQNVKYAKLDAIVARVRPVLAEFGFAVAFHIDQSEKGVIAVSATLTHKNGHSESTSISLPHETSGSKNAVQAVGSTITYGKRYTICSLLNIATGDDHDGYAANQLSSEDYSAMLKNSKTMHQLGEAWGKVPANLKKELTALKDELKAGIAK